MKEPKYERILSSKFVDPLFKDFTTRANITTGSNLVDGQPSSSIIDDLFVVPKIRFELPDVNLLAKHITDMWYRKMDRMLVQNSQVLIAGVTLGAAISTGVFIGMFSVAWLYSLPSSSSSSSSSSSTQASKTRFSSAVWRSLFWYRDLTAPSTTTNSTERNSEDETQTGIATKNDISTKEESDRTMNDTSNRASIQSKDFRTNDLERLSPNRNNSNVAILKSDHVIIIQGNPIISISGMNEELQSEATIGKSSNNGSSKSMCDNNDGNRLEGNQRKIVNDILSAQYRSCLNSITESLNQQSLNWTNVGNVNVKLVSTVLSRRNNNNVGDNPSSCSNDDFTDDDDGENAKLFRSMLNEYTMTSSPKRNTLVSISFVWRLEDIHSKIQVEVLAS